jgi:uncharacterized protein (TIRG00374 family)
MQHNHDNPDRSATRPRLARTRFVGLDRTQQTTSPLSNTGDLSLDQANSIADQPAATTTKPQVVSVKKAVRPRLPAAFLFENWNTPIENQSTAHLMQLSGMMRPVRLPDAAPAQASADEDGYWPLGIQQTGPLPIKNLYGREPFGRTLPQAVPVVMPGLTEQAPPLWRKVLSSPIFKVSFGLLIGLALLFLVSRFIDLQQTLTLLATHLSTPQGIALALLAGITYLTGHSIRGLRWKLFLNPVGRVPILKVIELYQVAIFLNFLLPIRAGEAARSLALKRIASIPISKSLPTIAIDKSLDLVPALVILVLVPFLGMRMDLQLWLVLGLAGGVLLALVIFIGLAAWKRPFAVSLLTSLLGLLPRSIGTRVEGFAIGFVDALLAGASRPRIFIPALLLTGLAVVCDGLFAMLAFWTIGFPISFGTALFGYTVYNMFYILPAPPGQIGSNEVVGLLVFSGLLHLPANNVTATYVFSHPWAALLITIVGLACLAALGLTISGAMRAQPAREKTTPASVSSVTA